ncbi:MAG: hypothetical protein A3C43_01030 [Candidatus Schekmanbacteria bacterium RIFCSPHIGHO2_02_FULL_38_11]|nr:MAG: hypothetical protein A2043_08075 [Candidatus Schekmanbacteria bacterium GWA2_38_9]OGL50050.1 MAG: hypothetical protein A3C43_01030 [Candidatus Schekmanbacteria bacterium RIFCSPHIGHO2_02_FULL_38_11]OGL51167.1 MAG: hypothetical protein A3H37_09105 [Candidatus Schekmanbacteria bacterium RIFCSPLOWO2_02_FULL_38_14]
MVKKDKIDLRDYLEIFYKRRIHFLTVFFIITTVTTIISYFLPKVYVSKSLILIERQNLLRNIVGQQAVGDEMVSKVRTFKERIISTGNLIDIIKKLDLDVNLKGLSSLENLISKMRDNIGVNVKGVNLFEISYEDAKPKICMLVIRTLIDNFVESVLTESRSETHSVFTFINNQLDQYKKNLEKSEATLKGFKEKHLGELPGEINTNLSKLSSYEAALAEARLSLNIAKLKKDKLLEQLKEEKPFINPFGNTEDRLRYLEEQLKSLLINYTDKYPEVVRIKKQIEKIKKQLTSKDKKESNEAMLNPETSLPNPVYQKIKEDLSSIEVEITSYQSRINEFERKFGEYQQKAQGVPQQEEELTRITRDYRVNEEIYQMLLRRLEEARISKELQADEQGEKFRIVDPPRIPINPIKPNRARIILLGLFFGVGVGVGVIVLLEYFDHSIRDLNEAKEFFEIPIIGTIPTILTDTDIKITKKVNLTGGIIGIIYLICIFALIILEFLKYNP